MKSKFKIIVLNICIMYILVQCASPKKYQNNMFDVNYFNNKTIYFLLSEKSNSVQIVKEGPNRGETKTPNNRYVFKNSIEELATETKLRLKYIENESQISEEDILVYVDIIDLKWTFGFSSLTMKSNLIYKIKDKEENYRIIGVHKTSMGGSKEWNLFNSLKNANYLFLKEMEKK